MKLSNEHFKSRRALGKEKFDQLEPLLRQKVDEHVTAALASSDVRSVARLTPQEIQTVAKQMPLVKQNSDLAMLPDQLGKHREFGFTPLFCPTMVDDCCKKGIFPLAQQVKRGTFVFTPKLHTNRSLVRLVDEAIPPIPATIEGSEVGDGNARLSVFDPRYCEVKNKLVGRCVVFINRQEDVSEVFQLIHLQHGEDWLCAPLRACMLEMLRRPEAYETRIVIFAVRAKETQELVAAEVGYIVADIYTSCTGAYCVSGCGSLQLALLGVWLRTIGVKVWDLGMSMDYKDKCLSCVTLPRNKWLQLVERRRKQFGGEQQASIAAALQNNEGQSFTLRDPVIPVKRVREPSAVIVVTTPTTEGDAAALASA